MQHLESFFPSQIRLAPDNLGYIKPDMSEGGHGEVAERPIAGALKAPEGKLSGGSNPSLAAKRRCVDLGGAPATAPSLAAGVVAWSRRRIVAAGPYEQMGGDRCQWLNSLL